MFGEPDYGVLVVVADAGRARLFRLIRQVDERPPLKLEEVASLVHPEARSKDSARYETASPFKTKTGAKGKGHTFDDHREAHDEEDLKRFASTIAETIKGKAGDPAEQLIVVSTHSIRHLLEKELSRLPGGGATAAWLTAEKTQLAPHELCADLAERGLLK